MEDKENVDKSEKTIKLKKPSELKEEAESMSNIFKRTKLLIKYFGGALVLIFTFLELSSLIDPKELIPMFTEKFSNIFFKVVIALYYLSWVAGTSKDVDDEEFTFLIAPNKGKLTNTAIGTMITLTVLFGCLCWANTYKLFAIALTVFYIFNIISWHIIKSFIKESLEKSIEKYEEGNDHLGAFKIKRIQYFLWGNWQTYRFIIGAILLLVVDVLAFTDISQTIKQLLKLPSAEFVIALSFFIYVGVLEIWIWCLRIERSISFNVVKKIKSYETYKLQSN